jgi:osmotically-inducible protein OsmY
LKVVNEAEEALMYTPEMQVMPRDSQLQQAVLAELSWDPSIVASHIGVTAKAGIVTLMGHVANFAEKHAAELAARRVKGVTGVAMELDVRLAFDHQRDDEDIAAAVVDRLAWDVSIPKDAISVNVDAGWVTLAGEVDWYYQRDIAEQDVLRLLGVTGLSNQVTIKQRPNAEAISDSIAHALGRSWLFDGGSVTVRATGGKVTLTGSVRTPHDRELAGLTAWAAAGTTQVENELAIA